MSDDHKPERPERPRLHIWGRRERETAPHYWRGWLSYGSWVEARVDVGLGGSARHCGVSLGDGGDGGLELAVLVWRLVNLWVSVSLPALARRRYLRAKARGTYRYRPARHLVRLMIHDRSLWWEFNQPSYEWHSGTPWWRSGHLNVWDLLVGRPAYESTPVHRATAQLALPEGAYPVEVTLTRDTWRRPRWRDFTIYRAEVTTLDGLPIPGKGEHSWDLGPTTVDSSTFPLPHMYQLLLRNPGQIAAAAHYNAVASACQHVTESVLATRAERGAPPDYAER